MKTKTLRTNQSGSIMLEVVAVLALMGIMGAMLFRQIYQRNQELHNIQMASEIRTVKEAFSAYIQANRTAVLNGCPIPGESAGCSNEDDVCKCNNVDGFYDDVAGYLPDGWFADADDLEEAYTLSLWVYKQEDTGRRTVYGIVMPTEGTLPTTGWNFKRAARVALLIGADGGAYDPSITHGEIAGALGAWQIESSGIIPEKCQYDPSKTEYDPECSLYVATTGIDLFAPEYELPEGEVNLRDPWDLGLHQLHAYNYFSVGNAGNNEKGCYTVGHTGSSLNTGKMRVENDGITTRINDDCKPLFWVGDKDGGANASSGNVYVATDLKIGDIVGNSHNEALTLTKEGVIKQKDGITITADGRILSRDKVNVNTGELKAGEYFMLDPGRTSVMGDIILSSRGGVRLSDILPNYILKSQFEFTSDTSSDPFPIDKPDCPPEYKKALAIFPTSWNPTGLKIDMSDLAGNLKINGTAIEENGTDIKYSVENDRGICVVIDGNSKAFKEQDGDWKIKLGYRNGNVDGECEYNGSFHAIVQTYCVWTPSFYDGDETKCRSAGYTYVGGKCTTTHGQDPNRDDVGGPEINEDVCTAYGYTWETSLDPDRCVFKFVDGLESALNNTSKLNQCMQVATTHVGLPTYKSHYETQAEAFARRAAVCKAAGYKWTQTSSTEGCCGDSCTAVAVPPGNCRS